MPRLFIGNFDFEHRLADPRRQLPAAVTRLNEELACNWTSVAEEGDYVWTPAAVDARFFDALAEQGLPRVIPVDDEQKVTGRVDLCPWGWTEAMCDKANSQNWKYDAPPQKAVRAVNSRRFSFELEREWNVALPGSAQIHTLQDLDSAIGHLPRVADTWIVKAEFGMSARERVLDRGTIPSPQTVAWVRKRLQSAGVVFFEPWIDRVEEVGLQFTIPRTGTPVFDGLTPLLTDLQGGYRGSRMTADHEMDEGWLSAIDIGMQAAERIQDRGYFGPLGIDAVMFQSLNEETQLRPLQDINARWTMGRLSMGLRKLLRPGEAGSWLHVRRPVDRADAWENDIRERLPNNVRLLITSPGCVGDRPVHHSTVLLATTSAQALIQAESIFTKSSSVGNIEMDET